MSLARSSIVIVTLIAAGCASSTTEATGSTRDRLSTQGDWSLLGGGQCLVAMQSFYPARFGVRLPSARDAYTGSCAPDGACHLWYDDIPDPAQWLRVPNDGSAVPSLYDLLVFAETTKNPYGHVASFDHMEGDTMYVMDSNYAGDEKRSEVPHEVRAPLGWYHLRSLGSVPATTKGVETCGDRAARLGWSRAYCEQADSSSSFTRVACGGVGSATDDCTRCCDAASAGPAHTDESCGAYAARVGLANPQCESGTSRACNGSGPSTGDGCTHCCDTP